MTGEHRTVAPPPAKREGDESAVTWIASERQKRAQNE
jgi:hypothetical protein